MCFFFGGGGGVFMFNSAFFFCFKNVASGKKCVRTFDETVNVLVECCVLDKWVSGYCRFGQVLIFQLSSGKLVIPRNCWFKFCWLSLVLKKKTRNKVNICTTILLGEFCHNSFFCTVNGG